MNKYYLLMTILLCSTSLSIYYALKFKKLINTYKDFETDLLLTNEEIQKTLLIGLYNRFKKEEGNSETTLEFEAFAAKVLKNYYGGTTYVTGSTGDYGIDVQHYRPNEGLCLGQVKCYDINNNVNFSPIAIIHSQMIKQKSTKGFVITTSDFTSNAIEYAKELNIDLINGKKLVQYWLKGFKKKTEKAKLILNKDKFLGSDKYKIEQRDI